MGTRSSLAKLSRELYPGLEAIDQNVVSVDDANTFTAVNTFSSAPLYTGVQRLAADAINIGSELNCYCGVAGQWIITGELIVDAVGSVPTIA